MDIELRKETFQKAESQREKEVRIPLSTQLFGIDWNKYFPYEIPNSPLVLKYSSYEESFDFLANNFAKIDDGNEISFPVVQDGTPEAKKRFYQTAGDFISCYDGDKLVGAFVGNPVDWSSYYFRGAYVLGEYRKYKAFRSWITQVLNILSTHNVNRAFVEVASSNLICVHTFNKLGFNVTGTRVSERWGSLLYFAKFLNTDSERLFLDRHCVGIRPQLNSPSQKS